MYFDWALDLDRCPKALITDEAWAIIDIWCDFRRYKALPYEGDILDQPYWVYQALEICERALSEVTRLRYPSQNGGQKSRHSS